VTFLLFLASLVVMEYIVRHPRKNANDNPKGADRGGATVPVPVSTETSMPGLLALGEALEAQGRGKVPAVEQIPQVHVPPIDGV